MGDDASFSFIIASASADSISLFYCCLRNESRDDRSVALVNTANQLEQPNDIQQRASNGDGLQKF